jgi:hypothetical protein
MLPSPEFRIQRFKVRLLQDICQLVISDPPINHSFSEFMTILKNHKFTNLSMFSGQLIRFFELIFG